MAQKVDPFIPVSDQVHRASVQQAAQGPLPLQKLPQGQYGQHLFQSAAGAPKPKPGRSVDGLKQTTNLRVPRQAASMPMRRRPNIAPQTRTMRATTTKSAVPQHVTQPPAVPQKQYSLSRRMLQKMQLPLLMLVAIGAGLLAQTLVFGEILVAAYAVFALVRFVSSRTTFLLALLTIACIIILLLIRTNNVLAANFAVYAFLLLLVGTVTLGREIKQGS